MTIEVDELDAAGATLLPTLLKAAVVWDRPLRWTLKSIEAVGQIEAVWPYGILELEEAASRHEVSLSPTEAASIADALDDVIEIELSARTATSGNRLLRISRFDSGPWRVDVSEPSFIEALVSLGVHPRWISDEADS